MMESLKWYYLRKHPPIIALLGFLGLGCGCGALYLMRLAIKNPDVIINKKGNPSPWTSYPPNHQHKFYAARINYKELKFPPERPNLEDQED